VFADNAQEVVEGLVLVVLVEDLNRNIQKFTQLNKRFETDSKIFYVVVDDCGDEGDCGGEGVRPVPVGDQKFVALGARDAARDGRVVAHATGAGRALKIENKNIKITLYETYC